MTGRDREQFVTFRKNFLPTANSQSDTITTGKMKTEHEGREIEPQNISVTIDCVKMSSWLFDSWVTNSFQHLLTLKTCGSWKGFAAATAQLQYDEWNCLKIYVCGEPRPQALVFL